MSPQEPPLKFLYDVREVAKMLGLGRSKLYSYLLRGELRSVKLGRRRLIPIEAVHEFVQALQSRTEEEAP